MVETIRLDAESFERMRGLSWWQRWRRGLRALRATIGDPDNTQGVLTAGMYLNTAGDTWRVSRFMADPVGQKLYAEDRTLDRTTVDLAALAQYPEGTFGRAYARFMLDRGLTPDVFEAPPGLVPPAYLIKRLRQSHDLWHVVTGYDTNIPGEVALQAFTYAQMRVPTALIISTFGLLRWVWRYPSMLPRVVSAYLRGRRTKWLAPIAWEELWMVPLSEVRARLAC